MEWISGRCQVLDENLTQCPAAGTHNHKYFGSDELYYHHDMECVTVLLCDEHFDRIAHMEAGE